MSYIDSYKFSTPPSTSCFTGVTTETFDDGNSICDWGFRIKLSIDDNNVSADLNNFLLMVDLSELPAAFFTNINLGGTDIRITEDDGVTEMPYYVSQISSTDENGILWTRFNGVLSSTVQTDIYIYYGNSSASAYAVGATYGRNNTFQDYEAFWDFEQDPSGSAPQLTDLTGNGNDGTSQGGMTSGDEVAGKIGNAWDFDGTDDYVPLATTLPFYTLPISVGGWVNPDDLANRYNFISSIDFVSVSNNKGWGLDLRGDEDTGKWRVVGFDNGATDVEHIDASLTGDVHIVGTLSNTATRLYLQGVLEAFKNTDIVNVSSSQITWISNAISATLNGKIAVFWLRNDTLSADYIAAEHANQNDPGNFIDVGPIETS